MKVRGETIFWMIVMALVAGFIAFGAVNSKERRAFLEDCKKTNLYVEHWKGAPTRIYDCNDSNISEN